MRESAARKYINTCKIAELYYKAYISRLKKNKKSAIMASFLGGHGFGLQVNKITAKKTRDYI